MTTQRDDWDDESHHESSIDTDEDSNTQPTNAHATDLTAFGRDALAVVIGAEDGLTIPQIQYGFERYGYEGRGAREIVDELVDAGLLQKVTGDDNRERLVATSNGRAVLRDHTQWLLAKIDLRAVDADHRLIRAEPATVPEDAHREDGEAVFDTPRTDGGKETVEHITLFERDNGERSMKFGAHEPRAFLDEEHGLGEEEAEVVDLDHAYTRATLEEWDSSDFPERVQEFFGVDGGDA